jgi:hypothetical protein
MRLYQNSKGQWFGTQADARRNSPRDWREVEVPTSKQDLLDWLNLHNFAPKSAGIAPEPRTAPEPKSELLSPHAASWVAWSLDNLKRGNKKDAEEMLAKGLKIQREWA